MIYSAGIFLKCETLGTVIFGEFRVVLFSAISEDDAHTRLSENLVDMEHSYLNSNDDEVAWKVIAATEPEEVQKISEDLNEPVTVFTLFLDNNQLETLTAGLNNSPI